jgi:hypothetical protein
MNAFHWARRIAWTGVAAAGAISCVSALAATAMGHIRGTIVAASAEQLTVRTTDGNVNVAIDPATKIAGIVKGSRDQIKAGTFVGIANVPGARTSRALEVVVFPDSMKGAGLGDYPWDLSPKAGKSSAMTNGTVTAASAGAGKNSAMTNGTVKGASSAHGLLLAVDYGKGEKQILVPPGVPVVGIVPADASKLVPGAHVFVSTKKDAPQTAGFITVGIDGVVPPM